MIGFEFANNTAAVAAEEALAIAKLQEELMLDASKYDNGNCNHGIFGMDCNDYDTMKADEMFGQKAPGGTAMKRAYDGQLLNIGGGTRRAVFDDFSAHQSRLPLYLDSHNSEGTGERFQDICASMTATQFNGLNNRDGGGGATTLAPEFSTQIKQPAGETSVSALECESLFCVPASNAVAPVGVESRFALSPSSVWQLYQAVTTNNAAAKSHVNHPGSNHFGPPHRQLVRDTTRNTSTRTAATTTTATTPPTKPKCLFKRAFSNDTLPQQLPQLQQQRSGSRSPSGLMCCVMPRHNIATAKRKPVDPCAAPSRLQLDTAGEVDLEVEELSLKSSEHHQSGIFSASKFNNSSKAQSFQQQQENANNTSNPNPNINNNDKEQQLWQQQSEPKQSLISGSVLSDKNSPVSLPLPPYCGCGCSGSIQTCFGSTVRSDGSALSHSYSDESPEADDDDEPVYYIVAAKRRKRSQNQAAPVIIAQADAAFLTIKNSAASVDRPTAITTLPQFSPQIPSNLLTPALTPQSTHSGASTELHYTLDNCSTVASNSAPQSPAVNCDADWCKWIDEIVNEVRSDISSERESASEMNSCYASSNASRAGSPMSAASSSNSCALQASPASSSDSSSSSSSSSSLSPSIPPITKRAKKYSLCALSHEQMAERKKTQNRIAAQRYRSKRSQTLEVGRQTIVMLEERNAEMRAQEREMLAEIASLKAVLGLTAKS